MHDAIKRLTTGLLFCVSILLTTGCAQQPVATEAQSADAQLFPNPDAAVAALHDLIGKGDLPAIERMFGPGSVELLDSGDPEQNREDFRLVKLMIQAGVTFEEPDPQTRIALFGADEWPWPIPLVKVEGGWRYDTAAGREEMLNRRIGRNELSTLDSLHAVVEAQAEYASEGRDGNPPAFAARFRSTDGRRDGLYWPPVEGEDLSPLGDLLAESEVVARPVSASTALVPYHGYYYRMLSAQGPSAPGGARSYLDERGLLTGGFAVVAWPAKYGNSGIMTFLVNQRGIVFQKDLGEDTGKIAAGIQTFDPDETWLPTADHVRTVAGE